MKSFNLSLYIIGLMFLFSSCEKVLMKPNPSTGSLAVFNEYSTLVKEKYAMLEFKGVDIDHLSDSIRQTITDGITSEELFSKLSILTLRLKDGHSDLSSSQAYTGYDFLEGYHPGFSFPILLDNYFNVTPTNLKFINTADNSLKVVHGYLPQSDEIAYIWIPSWDIELSDDELESIFSSINSAKGLIIDIRLNTGGDPALATKFASYFMDQTVYTGFERFKVGPDATDFSDSKAYLNPANSDNRFLKPVVVLVDRFCYSAATTFAYSLNPLDQVTFIGQRTGGGSGSVTDGFLANGWKWSLSTSEFIDHLGNHLDNGIEPDISVALDTTDKSQDEVIERALLHLQ